MGELVMAGVAVFWIGALVVDFRDRRHRKSREQATAGATSVDNASTGAPSGQIFDVTFANAITVVALPSDDVVRGRGRTRAATWVRLRYESERERS